jgi:hypothetical protein
VRADQGRLIVTVDLETSFSEVVSGLEVKSVNGHSWRTPDYLYVILQSKYHGAIICEEVNALSPFGYDASIATEWRDFTPVHERRRLEALSIALRIPRFRQELMSVSMGLARVHSFSTCSPVLGKRVSYLSGKRHGLFWIGYSPRIR